MNRDSQCSAALNTKTVSAGALGTCITWKPDDDDDDDNTNIYKAHNVNIKS